MTHEAPRPIGENGKWHQPTTARAITRLDLHLRSGLIVGVTSGDLDHTPVRHGHGLQKAQRTAVADTTHGIV